MGLRLPVEGSIVAPFAPAGSYAGHWGVDISAQASSIVGAASPGVVSFSGLVAGNNTISVDHGGGLKTSYSFLAARRKGSGARVSTGSPVGVTGLAHDGSAETAALHFSVRIHGAYVDPESVLGCVEYDVSEALRLLPAD